MSALTNIVFQGLVNENSSHLPLKTNTLFILSFMGQLTKETL